MGFGADGAECCVKYWSIGRRRPGDNRTVRVGAVFCVRVGFLGVGVGSERSPTRGRCAGEVRVVSLECRQRDEEDTRRCCRRCLLLLASRRQRPQPGTHVEGLGLEARVRTRCDTVALQPDGTRTLSERPGPPPRRPRGRDAERARVMKRASPVIPFTEASGAGARGEQASAHALPLRSAEGCARGTRSYHL